MIKAMWALGVGAAAMAAALWPRGQSPQVLILSGDTNGNLAPCGCTKPMTGGIKRRVAAALSLSVKGRTTLLDNGGLVAGSGRQDQIKAESLAEILGKAGWDAINVGPSEAKLGAGELMALQSLSEGKMLASGLQSADLGLQRFTVSGPFLVLGLSTEADAAARALGATALSNSTVLSEGIAQAKEAGLAAVLLLQGTQDQAKAIAVQFPELALVQFRSGGDATERPLRIGKTLLVSPGADGKHLLRLVFSGGQFRDYGVVALGPEFADDPTAARIYRAYLSRVSGEKLLEAIPRFSTTAFAGNEKCESCHTKPAHVWKSSLHAKALVTLQKRGHDRDPDCLPCHVVGLSSQNGFKSPSLTPQLAYVGCESCHGSGVLHSETPVQAKMPNTSEKVCVSCHTVNTSPGFKFSTYWQRVRH